MEAAKTIARIEKEFNENVNSHVFLFETNAIDKALTDVKKIIKSVLKANSTVENQIDEENYLELCIIKTDGKEIKKDQILLLQDRIKIKPVLSKYMFYIILNAEKLNETAANKLLKTIEEPNENIIGFLISSNNDLILPTIKSRCQIERLEYLNIISDDINPEVEKTTRDIIEIIEKGTLIDLNIYLFDKKQKDFIKENGKKVACRIKDYYNTACEVKKMDEYNVDVIKLINDNSKYKEKIAIAEYLNKRLNKLTQNMNAELLLEMLYIDLEEVKKNASSRS